MYVTDDGLKTITEECTALTSLNIYWVDHEKVTDQFFESVANNCKQLESFGYEEDPESNTRYVSDKAMQYLVQKIKLKKLKWNFFGDDEEEFIQSIKYMTDVEDLDLTGRITDRAVEMIGKTCKNLKVLRLWPCDPPQLMTRWNELGHQLITNVGLNNLVREVGSNLIYVHFTDYSDENNEEGIRNLVKKCGKLKFLDVCLPNCADGFIPSLRDMANSGVVINN